jgi:KipI family sensor histidine kinase inhibitor
VRAARVDETWQFAPAGDQGLLVTIGTAIDPALLGQLLALDRALRERPPRGLLNTVPAYAALLCRFDPEVTDAAELEAELRRLEGSLDPAIPPGPVVDVPTRYGGPDLAEVAQKTDLTPAAVIEAHASRAYLVYCLGFAPGFTYCGSLPDELTVPRRPSPRLRVPPGSVAIAGRQTGIYAVASPGGWNLIGHTDLRLFDVGANPPARFKPGDRIRFVPER